MKTSANAYRLVLPALLLAAGTVEAIQVTATFDDLPSPPALDSGTALYYANNSGSVYQGITWDSRFNVGGDEYRVNPLTNPPPNPTFGIPHSGHYFASNDNGADGLLITTSWLMTGAWFGRNEYYGYGPAGSGGGADQITIVALAGSTALGVVVFDLPDTNVGNPDPLSFVDTSAFGALAGITGYRIDRRPQGQYATNWVADDFTFETNPVKAVPEPASLALFAAGLAGLLRGRGGREG